MIYKIKIGTIYPDISPYILTRFKDPINKMKIGRVILQVRQSLIEGDEIQNNGRQEYLKASKKNQPALKEKLDKEYTSFLNKEIAFELADDIVEDTWKAFEEVISEFGASEQASFSEDFSAQERSKRMVETLKNSVVKNENKQQPAPNKGKSRVKSAPKPEKKL